MLTEPIFRKSSKPSFLLIGAPLLDLIFPVQESFLNQLSGKKGGMETINEEELQELASKAGAPARITLGGSAANVARVIAHLGGDCAFAGAIGNDEAGSLLQSQLHDLKIISYCHLLEQPTGQALCFISPDHHRTCRTFLGASQDFNLSDLHPLFFKNKTLTHLEGYTLAKPGLTAFAFQEAKAAGSLISFDLGSFEIVENHLVTIERLLPKMDIIFANEQEAYALTHEPPEKSCLYLKEVVKIAIVFHGKKGAYIGMRGQPVFHIPAVSATTLDTTGAGDFFAGTFLYALLSGKSPLEAARCGSFAASKVIQSYGAQLEASAWKEIRCFHHLLSRSPT
ncbi:MAG: adenosine kinase [Parachlamydiaceae bacterium]